MKPTITLHHTPLHLYFADKLKALTFLFFLFFSFFFFPCEQNDRTLFDVNELCERVVYRLQGQFLRRAAGFSCKHIYSQRCVNTVNVYRCSRRDTGPFSSFSLCFFPDLSPVTHAQRLVVGICVYFWKHFKVMCALTKSRKKSKKKKRKNKITLRKRNDVPAHSVKAERGETERRGR